MGLELVGGTKGEGQGQAAAGPGQGRMSDGGGNSGAESLAAAESAVAGVRLRLSALADRLAELQRRLDLAGTTGDARSASASASASASD